ncbi:hypothetical protein ACFXHA_40810 [Nocardia sp. NPDC059240]|uniref:hypothetical protein n=1 Tax=Nocardia sp. NPDC059240 TaxID=3346786 RepID=UPI0036B45E96
MEPVTMIAAAIAAGAAAGLTDTAKKAVTDAYLAARAIITRRYQNVDISVVETRPGLPSRRAVLADELQLAGAGNDPELIQAAQHLLVVVQQAAPAAAEAVGIQLRRIEADELEISYVTSSGSGVIAEDIKATGTIRITDVHAGPQEPPHPPTAARR